MRGSTGVVALTCALAACVGAWPAAASFPGANGRIVFSSNRRADLQQQVFAVPAGGGPARNVSRRPAFMNSGPAAAAGSVVYGSGPVTGDGQPSVWLVTRSGSQRRLVTGTAPLLSPDGTRVLYASPQQDALFVLDLRSGAKSQVADVGPPAAWSPDGRWIAYGVGDGVMVVRADGGESRRLLSTLARVRPGAWAPDGKRLVVETTIFSDEPETTNGEPAPPPAGPDYTLMADLKDKVRAARRQQQTPGRPRSASLRSTSG